MGAVLPRGARAEPPIALAESESARSVALAPTVSDPSLAALGREVDAAISDAVKDLGLSLVAKEDASREVRATLGAAPNGAIDLRITLAPVAAGGDATPRTLEKRVPRGDAAIEAVVLLRRLVQRVIAKPPPVTTGSPAAVPVRDRLAGRVTLMTSAGVLGGVVGYSIQAASGSNDARLLVPLTIVGAGIGLGGAYLASGEWDITPADAWFFNAGAVWGTAAGHLVFQGRFAADRESSDRWVFGLVGGGIGATLATVGLTLHPMTDGGALLANVGGAGGLGIGALVELAARRSTSTIPCTGMGYGAALGWLAAATIAVNVRPRWIDKPLARAPAIGVLGETRAGDRAAPILGLGYGGSLAGLPGPFHL